MPFAELSQILGNFGEFVGAIAVVITLAYLAVQVRHSKIATEANTKIAEENRLLALAQNQIARVSLIERQVRDLSSSKELAEIFIKSKKRGLNALDDVELYQLENWHIIQHYLLDSQHYQHELGLLDDDSWQDAVRRIKFHIPVWEQLDLSMVGRSAFRAEVEKIAQSMSPA